MTPTLTIDQQTIPITGERNLLELIRKANIELPTFCYHSELSVYGACRLCIVHVEGRGLLSACSTLPQADMVVKTQTQEIRNMRQIIVELLLARHDQSCTTCPKSSNCQLQDLAQKLGIKTNRFKLRPNSFPIDESSDALVRDPNKCVLCGDCVRICSEIQSVGAIDFANRGSAAMVMPCFGKDLSKGECVYCGQCARVCPTGAITIKSEVEKVWGLLDDPRSFVIAHIAPAVRVALGEAFGFESGQQTVGQIIAALRLLGFDKVYDTAFTADLTVIEESTEFISRLEQGGPLPQFTSCCPAWVRFVEQFYPEFNKNLSSCRSPQQMFGSLAKSLIPSQINRDRTDVNVVSIMPCTAKKTEAHRSEFITGGERDTDYVITTQELIRMIKQAGIRFGELESGSFDMPLGFKSGAGVIFGSSGGVSEAVLRYVVNKSIDFLEVRGIDGLRETSIMHEGREIRLAVVSGLHQARLLLERIKKKEVIYDLIEVMACPGGCIGGAGQPVYHDESSRKKRAKGLYENDRTMELHCAQENPYVQELYTTMLENPGSKKAHSLLHTRYKNRKRNIGEDITISAASENRKVEITICFGTHCFQKGAQTLTRQLSDYLHINQLNRWVEIKASFCYEKCQKGPLVKIDSQVIEQATMDKIVSQLLMILKV